MQYLNETLLYSQTPADCPANFCPLRDLPLILLVGLTGVGKSTVVEGLQQQRPLTVLPNRRTITDQVIIASLQRAKDKPVEPITDRLARFSYTALYRNQHQGGLAHALGRLAIRRDVTQSTLLFDGLRGVDEVTYAAGHFPQARFLVLDAPDAVRLERLLTRGDAFDAVMLDAAPPDDGVLTALNNINGIDMLLSSAERQRVAHLARAQEIPPAEVAKKAAIIVEEQRNYDSSAAQAYLRQRLPPARLKIIDTARHKPAEVIAQAAAWLAAPQI